MYKDELREADACDEALEWVGDRDRLTAWQECTRADWMLWELRRIDGWYSPRLRLCACDCARTALPYAGEYRDTLINTLDVVERYAAPAHAASSTELEAAELRAGAEWEAADVALAAARVAGAVGEVRTAAAHAQMCDLIRARVPHPREEEER